MTQMRRASSRWILGALGCGLTALVIVMATRFMIDQERDRAAAASRADAAQREIEELRAHEIERIISAANRDSAEKEKARRDMEQRRQLLEELVAALDELAMRADAPQAKRAVWRDRATAVQLEANVLRLQLMWNR